jgi:hypothetical protein
LLKKGVQLCLDQGNVHFAVTLSQLALALCTSKTTGQFSGFVQASVEKAP